MAAGATYEPIATHTLASTTSTYTFTSIPATYTDLVLVCNWKNTGGSGYWGQIILNNDTGNAYSNTILEGNGSTASSYRYSNRTDGIRIAGLTTGNFFPSIVNLQNYSNTTTYKTVLARYSDASYAVQALVGLFRSTSAISSIKIQVEDGFTNITAGSTFTLYGIKAA
jgi:hypothetical protein